MDDRPGLRIHQAGRSPGRTPRAPGFRGIVFGSRHPALAGKRLGRGNQDMKLLMFREGGERRLGVVRGGASKDVIDVGRLAQGNGSSGAPADILSLIESGEDGM